MTATAALIGSGSEFWLDNASGSLTQLAEIISVTPPQSTVSDVEATHMLSPNRRREWIAGLIDDGEGEFTMNYVAGSATDLLIQAALTDGVTRSYKIVIPDGSSGWEITGDCVVKGYARNIPIDDRMTAALTVRFSGAPSES